MRLVTSIILVALIASCGLTSQNAKVKVMVRPESAVTPMRSVKLADVAEIRGPVDLARKLGDVALALGPMPGQVRSIDLSSLKARLKTAGLDKAADITGPAKLTIVGKATKFEATELIDHAKAYLQTLLPAGSRTYEIEVQREPRELVVVGEASIRPRLLGTAPRLGTNTVALDAVVNDKIVATSSVALVVKAVANVLVASSTIRQGEVLSEANTTWQPHDITKLQNVIEAPNNVIGRIARRSIAAGSAITTADVADPPVVLSGETVTLTVICGAVTIRTTAEAKQDGKVGDVIRVKPLPSDQDVRAKVTGSGAVEMRS